MKRTTLRTRWRKLRKNATRSDRLHPVGRPGLDYPRRAACASKSRSKTVTPVDATGAGDQFAAGFLFGLATGRDMDTAGRMGCMKPPPR